MNRISDILALAQAAVTEDIDAVLATVVHTEGSAYRRAGAMMLICADGRSVGMISGGCLEPHIIKRAFWLTRKGASVQVYQTGDSKNGQVDDDNTDNEDIELNFGLGCNGRVHILFERLDTAMPFLNVISRVRDTYQPLRIATLIRSAEAQHRIGSRFYLDISGYVSLNHGDFDHNSSDYNKDSTKTHIQNTVMGEGNALSSQSQDYSNALSVLADYPLENKKTAYVPVTTVPMATGDNNLAKGGNNCIATLQTQWLIQAIQPQKRLLICGAGNDVIPLVTLAKQQDWHVTVIDSRPHYAKLSRFLSAGVAAESDLSKPDKVICMPLDDENQLIALSRNAAVAVMSHSLTQDRARLKVLLQHPPAYLGQLGPTYRTERLLAEITTASDNPNVFKKGIEQLHYPVGFKLGGEGPEALALGIMAQMMAHMMDEMSDKKLTVMPQNDSIKDHSTNDVLS